MSSYYTRPICVVNDEAYNRIFGSLKMGQPYIKSYLHTCPHKNHNECNCIFFLNFLIEDKVVRTVNGESKNVISETDYRYLINALKEAVINKEETVIFKKVQTKEAECEICGAIDNAEVGLATGINGVEKMVCKHCDIDGSDYNGWGGKLTYCPVCYIAIDEDTHLGQYLDNPYGEAERLVCGNCVLLICCELCEQMDIDRCVIEKNPCGKRLCNECEEEEYPNNRCGECTRCQTRRCECGECDVIGGTCEKQSKLYKNEEN